MGRRDGFCGRQQERTRRGTTTWPKGPVPLSSTPLAPRALLNASFVPSNSSCLLSRADRKSSREVAQVLSERGSGRARRRFLRAHLRGHLRTRLPSSRREAYMCNSEGGKVCYKRQVQGLRKKSRDGSLRWASRRRSVECQDEGRNTQRSPPRSTHWARWRSVKIVPPS